MEYFSLIPDYGHQIILNFPEQQIHEGAGESDYVVAPKQHPLISFDLSKGFYYQSIQEELEVFFNAVNGRQDTFLILDPSDSFASKDPTTTGLGAQTQGVVYDDGAGNYQLGKLYNVSGFYVVRPIRHTDNTLQVFYSNGDPAAVTVDQDTGRVTGATQPGMTWEGNFWVAVRFDLDTLPTEILSYDPKTDQALYSLPALKIVEVREEHLENNAVLSTQPDLAHTWMLSTEYRTQKIFRSSTDIEFIGSGFEKREEYYQTQLKIFGLSEKRKIHDTEKIYVIALYRVAMGRANQFTFNDTFKIGGTPTTICIDNELTLTELSKPSPQNHLFTLAPLTFKEVIPYVLGGGYEENVHYYCHCWQVTRKDSLIHYFTDHDIPITISSNSYTPIAGFSASSTQETSQLNPDAQDLKGFPLAGILEENDVISGKYDQAEIKVFLVDWEQKIILATLYQGDFIDSSYGYSPTGIKAFTFKSKSRTERLNKEQHLKTTQTCRHKFLSQGKNACNKSVTGLTLASSVVSVISNSTFVLADDATQYADTLGTLQFTSGDNNGITIRIDTAATTQVTLLYPPPLPVNIGDTVLLTEGCDKSIERCDELGNEKNYGGQPLLPGIDNLIRNPT